MADQSSFHHTDFEKIVEGYATIAEPLTGPFCLDALVGLDLGPAVRLLDVATGTGALAMAAARQHADVLAVDVAAGMIAYLDARAKKAQLANLQTRVMNGQALDLPDASFDVVCSVFGVILFADYRAGLAEIRRVVKPGGSVRLVGWGKPEQMPHIGVWTDAIRDAFPEFESIDRPAGWRAMETPERFATEVERSGFSAVQIDVLQHDWSIPSVDWFVGPAGILASTLFESVFERLGPGSEARVRDRLRARLQEQYGDQPFALPATAYLATCQR